jgi:hypothetical protein
MILALVPQANAGLGIGARYSYVHNNGIEDNSSMFGAMVRLRHMTFFGLEGAIDYRKEEFDNGNELRSTPITASLMIYPIPVAYGLVGIGFYRSTLETTTGAEATDTKIGYHYGIGAEVPLVPLVKLTGDIRYQFIDYEFEDIAESVGKVEADGYAISAGVIVYLK